MMELLSSLAQAYDELEWISLASVHNARQPLTIIQGHLDLMRSEYPNEGWDPIENAVSDLDEFLSAHLAFKTERPHIELSIIRLMNQFLRDYKWLTTRGVTATVQGTDFHFSGNAEQINQCLRTLVDNAVDAMPHGGSLRFELTAGPGWGEVAVEDTGPGVPASHQHCLFYAGQSTKATGHGIGLVYLRRIVELHGGSVRYEDGQAGARFVLRFPTI